MAINFIYCPLTFKALETANRKEYKKNTNIIKTRKVFHKLLQRDCFPHLLEVQLLPEIPLNTEKSSLVKCSLTKYL